MSLEPLEWIGYIIAGVGFTLLVLDSIFLRRRIKYQCEVIRDQRHKLLMYQLAELREKKEAQDGAAR